DIYTRTKIDRWFLHNVREIVEMEDRIRACPGLYSAGSDLLRRAKQYGFSDRQLAHLWNTSENEVRRRRKSQGVEPSFKLVDTCAAEFEASTPYYYSSYETPVIRMGTETGERTADNGEPITATDGRSLSRPSAADLGASFLEDETRPPSGK